MQPVGLRFVDTRTGAPSFSPCYVGDDTLVGSVWRTLSGPPVTAVVCFGGLQEAGARDRRAWAVDLHAAVDALRQPAAASAQAGERRRRVTSSRGA